MAAVAGVGAAALVARLALMVIWMPRLARRMLLPPCCAIIEAAETVGMRCWRAGREGGREQREGICIKLFYY